MKKKLTNWQDAFSVNPLASLLLPKDSSENIILNDIADLKKFLTLLYIKHYLVKPYFTTADYPLLDYRELLPAFDPDPWEYTHLPAFSLVIFDRPIQYFKEIFQFDLLRNNEPEDKSEDRPEAATKMPATPSFHHISLKEDGLLSKNEGHLLAGRVGESLPSALNTMLSRIPRHLHDSFRSKFSKMDITKMSSYPMLLPYLGIMDRGQVMAKNEKGEFSLTGVYASFPSDLDAEIKRFGIRTGKFRIDDDKSYEFNRLFVYQYLMELYGFPTASERRTSAALFARRLHKLGEKFAIFVMGHSDRCLTLISNIEEADSIYPKVEKYALVQVDHDQEEALSILDNYGLFLDKAKRSVILRVTYQQHKFNPNNIRQERALSAKTQEVIHPLTGERYSECNILKDVTNFLLRLNDIVRGEYTGRTIYKRTEIIENTDTTEKQLKFLYSWLSKNQVRIIGYSDDFFASIEKVLLTYFQADENADAFENVFDLYQEVLSKFSYIQQARKVRLLEDLSRRQMRNERLDYGQMLFEMLELLHELIFEMVNYFDQLACHVINILDNILNDSYLVKKYIAPQEDHLTTYGMEVRRNYKKLVAMLDDFLSIRKVRCETN